MATYHFGGKTCNSVPFLFKIGANEAYLQGVPVAVSNRLQLVSIGPVQSGFLFFRRLELQLKVQSFPVQSSLSPVFFRSYRPDFKTLPVTSRCRSPCISRCIVFTLPTQLITRP